MGTIRVFHDWEFLECESGIYPISVAMKDDVDGGELYLIFRDAPLTDIQENPWLMEYVVPHLPLSLAPGAKSRLTWNTMHPDYDKVQSPHIIKNMVGNYLEKAATSVAAQKVELWGWYSNYDHVLLSRLFGRMIDLPDYCPMHTLDLKQEVRRLGNPYLEQPPAGQEHYPLAEVRQMLQWYDQLSSLAMSKGVQGPGDTL